MKKLIMICLVILSYIILSAQTEDWLWAAQGGSSANDEGNSIAIDSNGYIYVTGAFRESATFGSITLVNAGNSDIFIAKLDLNGNWLWAKQAGGSMADFGNGLVVDNAGNCYVTGQFKQTAIFGTITLESDNRDSFIAKLDTNGNWLWVKQTGANSSNSGAEGVSLIVDSNNNILMVGQFWGSVNFGSTTLLSTTSMYGDIYVAKLSADGDWLNIVQAGGSNGDDSGGIAGDNNGNYYISGTFWGTADFGSTTLISNDGYAIYVAKLDNNFNWLWAVKNTAGTVEKCSGIATDNSGNAFITGSFYNSISFGTTTLNSLGQTDILISKLDTNGNWIWAKQAGEALYDEGYAITTDIEGNCYVTGYFSFYAAFGPFWLDSYGQEDIFICKLDANGNWLWADVAGGIQNFEWGGGIVTDYAGNSYVTGKFKGTAYFGTHTIYSAGFYDVFVAKMGLGSSVDPQQLPATSVLFNYPNPFNPVTTIEFSIREGDSGSLTIFNITGQKILEKEYPAGNHLFHWNADDQASGVYFYQLKTPSYNRINKAVLLK